MTILITGANRGIGAEMRRHYIARGESVIGTHRSAATDGFLQLDVTNAADQENLASALASTPISTLICNAGVYLDKGQTLDDGYAPALWADTFAANVTGVFLTIQHLLPSLTGDAKIAIISSQMGAISKATGGSYIYRASKAAALNLGTNLAADLKARGISVGIYHPGWVQTDMGGQSAAISPEVSAKGLIAQIDTLGLETTGQFKNWDGTTHPL